MRAVVDRWLLSLAGSNHTPLTIVEPVQPQAGSSVCTVAACGGQPHRPGGSVHLLLAAFAVGSGDPGVKVVADIAQQAQDVLRGQWTSPSSWW